MNQFEALFRQPAPSLLQFRINVWADTQESARQAAHKRLFWLFGENPNRFLPVEITQVFDQEEA